MLGTWACIHYVFLDFAIFCADITVFNVRSSAFHFLSYYYKQLFFRTPIAMEMMLRTINIHFCFVFGHEPLLRKTVCITFNDFIQPILGNCYDLRRAKSQIVEIVYRHSRLSRTYTIKIQPLVGALLQGKESRQA